METQQGHRSTKKDIKAFVEFFLSDEVQGILKYSEHPHLLAVQLYKERTGKVINRRTAFNNFKIWAKVNIDGRDEYIKSESLTFNSKPKP